MEYLANPFNLSINHFSNEGIFCILNVLNIELFYYIFSAFMRKLENIEINEEKKRQNRNLAMIKGEFNISEIPDIVYNNVFDDETIDEKIKKNLLSLLDINSLDRYFILYYIFKLHGCYLNNNLKFIDVYSYFKEVEKQWKQLGNNSNEYLINLDETLEQDYFILIDKLMYGCNMAHTRFLSWLYYSGIYNFLIEDNQIKKKVLHIMNSRKLLVGNIFLKYQLYLLTTEDNNNADNNDNITETYFEQNLIDEEMETGEEMESGEELESNEELESGEEMESGEDGIQSNFDLENEEELQKRPIAEDISNFNLNIFSYIKTLLKV